MTKRMQNFIFDIDGTLIDTLDMYMPAMIQTLRNHGYQVAPEDEEETMHRLFGITGVDALRIFGVKEDEIAPMVKEWFALSYQREDRVKILPGIPETLQTLADEGKNLAVATSKLQSEYDHFKQQFAFAKLFNTVITSDDTKKHKPDPEPILAAVEDGGRPGHVGLCRRHHQRPQGGQGGGRQVCRGSLRFCQPGCH